MKKVLTVLLTFATIFTIAGCKKKKTKANTTTIDENYITADVEGNLFENGNFNYGEVELASSGDQLIKTTEGGGEWWLYALNGGFGQMKINNKRQLEVGIVMTSNVMHGVQFAYDGFAITKGSKYKFEFDACCDIERSMEVRIQQNGGSYENYILEGKEGNLIDKLGTTMKHYTYEFTSTVTDIAPRMALNLGWFDGEPQYKTMPKGDFNVETGEMIYPHYETITLDNFVLTCTYDSGVVIDPLELAKRPQITLNQVGFMTDQTKQAVFRADRDKMDTSFKIVDASTNEVVHTGSVSVKGTNTSSLEYVGIADFTSFKTPGTYKVVGTNCGESVPFVINDNVYGNLTSDVIMMLYKQRCGEVLGEAGDKFAHTACHTTPAKVFDDPDATPVDVSGGWHDAGDYGKYVVAGAQTVANLLMTYERTNGDPDVFFKYDSYVTEDTAIPDILEEAMWELDWMLKMQIKSGDKAGQVYHKVSTLEFPENSVLPQNDNGQLYLSATSYAATADFAAVMAYASRIVELYDSTRADNYADAAELAYAALASMSKTSFKNPDAIKTGEYPDSDLDDELAWASIELYVLTGTSSYLDAFKTSYSTTTDLGLGWANVNGFAAFEATRFLSPSDGAELYKTIAKSFIDYADKLVVNAKADAYNVTIGATENGYVFEWGSNLTIASNGIILDLAITALADDDVVTSLELTSEQVTALIEEYSKYKQTQLNYLLGQNACAYCFVTGYGYKSDGLTLTPVNPHHRPSIANGEPMKGMLVGGPDSNFAENGNDSVATRACKNASPAHCYIDNNNSWSTNEITIYWNSPLIYLLVSVEADLLP